MKKIITIPDEKIENFNELASKKGQSLQSLIIELLDREVQYQTRPRFFTREILIKNILKSNEALEAQLKANNELLRGLK